MLPSIRMGGPAVFLVADNAWRLLAVSADGVVRLWNLQLLKLELETSVEALLLGAASTDRGTGLVPTPSIPVHTSTLCVMEIAMEAPAEGVLTIESQQGVAPIALHSPLSTAISFQDVVIELLCPRSCLTYLEWPLTCLTFIVEQWWTCGYRRRAPPWRC